MPSSVSIGIISEIHLIRLENTPRYKAKDSHQIFDINDVKTIIHVRLSEGWYYEFFAFTICGTPRQLA